jgi:hypothetical protein
MRDARSVREFGYYLSAFLTALSSFTELALIRKHGRDKSKIFQELKHRTDGTGFLLLSRDVEVHREGVRIWLYGSLWGELLRTTSISRTQNSSRYRSRYQSRFQPRYGDMRAALEITTPTDKDARCSFIFEGSGQDVFKSCVSVLDAVRSLATEAAEGSSKETARSSMTRARS